MHNIHQDFRSKKILNYVRQLIHAYSYKQFTDLSNGDLCEFVALLIEAGGMTDAFNCITDSVHSDQNINLFRAALVGKKDANETFIDTLKDNAINYYSYTMNQIFDYTINDYESEICKWVNAA